MKSLWRASRQGELPIVVDTSPCTFKMQHYDAALEGDLLEQWHSLKIMDILEYLNDEVLPQLTVKHKVEQVVLHPTCSTRKMGLEGAMQAVAEACADIGKKFKARISIYNISNCRFAHRTTS